MSRAYYLNTHFKNLISNGTLVDDNLEAFLDKVKELAPESVYDVGFELGHRLSQLYGAGIKVLGGCETDLLCGTYGHNHFNLFDIPDIYLEFFDSIGEALPKKNWDLGVFYGERPSNELVSQLSPFFKRMLFWTNEEHFEVYYPATTVVGVEPSENFISSLNYTFPLDGNETESVTFQEGKIMRLTPEELLDCQSWLPSEEQAKTLFEKDPIEENPNDNGQ